MKPEAWRLIVDAGADAAQNMAIDEAMLEAYERAGDALSPTLRLYGWSSPSYSLGRTQRVTAAEVEGCLASGFEVVRRPTGGDGVLHEHERTYAVVGVVGSADFPRGVVETYARISRALVAAVAALGVTEARTAQAERRAPREPAAVCFERLSGCEVVAAGRKLVGSAQARRRRAFLQHGSIPIRLGAARLAEAAGRPVDGETFTDLSRASGRELSTQDVDRALVAAFEKEFAVRLVAAPLTPGESLRAAELRAWRYDSLAWTRDGAWGERERRWLGAPAH
jgi:lipoate-protein ligase A